MNFSKQMGKSMSAKGEPMKYIVTESSFKSNLLLLVSSLLTHTSWYGANTTFPSFASQFTTEQGIDPKAQKVEKNKL